MKILLVFLWRWSWVVTLPVSCFFVFWAWNTAGLFSEFGLRYNAAPLGYNLHETGEKEFYILTRKALLSLSNPFENNVRRASDLKVINLFVPESGLARLNLNLPHSGYNYVKGSLWNGDKLQKIKFRYRGDFVYHWGERKKSLRVKTSKKKLFNGIRKFNLIAPKQLETHFGCLLAKEMGLIAPRSDLVEVTLNGKLLGTHVFVEQLEELTIRDNGYMPGDLYAGELFAKDSYRGVPSIVFNYPGLWEKLATNNHFNEESRKPLERLMALVNSPGSEQVHRELVKLIDVQAWGRFLAFETLTQTFHYDSAHNWRLYFDPMNSRFYPVIWDPLAWNPYWVPRGNIKAQLDIVPSLMHEFLFKDADILRARTQALDDFFKNRKDIKFLKEIDQVLPSYEKAIKRDPLRTKPLIAELSNIHYFRKSVETVFTDVKQGYFEKRKQLKYANITNDPSEFHISLSVLGRVPLNKLSLEFRNTINNPVTGILSYYKNGKKIDVDISGAISTNGSTVEIKKNLISSYLQILVGPRSLKQRQLQIKPGYYECRLNGLDLSNQLVDISVNYVDGKEEVADRVAVLEKTSFFDLYNIVIPQPVEIPIIWNGVVTITDVTEINRPLVIEPGAIIQFSTGATLILKNRVIAVGSTEQPITFVPLKEGQEPWGGVVLKGSNANTSRFKYCEFSGGSGLKGDLFEYTAMLSIHDVKGVEIENCIFRDSKITDDMVHAVYSEVRFSDCLFERSLMDALDVDISDVVVERCHFSDSGNDSIDLMTSNAVVIDTIIENGADKAASVGEGSKLLAINNVFRNNVIGVQAKDGSVAAIYNTDLIGNDHALDAYKKNWRYNDGGKIYVYKSLFEKNNKMITADKKSKIRVYDSYIDKPVAEKKKRIKLDDTVDSHSERKAKINKLVRYKKEVKAMKKIDSRYWERVDTKRRGAVNVANH